MAESLSNTGAVTLRVLRQLAHDRRFVALAVVVPAAVVFMLYMFFNGVDAPIFDPLRFVVPVGAYIVHVLTYALTAIVLVRERTGQTLGRMFINGYRQGEIIAGYLLAYSVLATVQSLIVLGGLNALFEMGYTLEKFLSVYLVLWMLAIISIGLGIFVSNGARNEGQVMPLIPLVIMVSVFFSGVILPVEKLPDWLQWAPYVTPVYYANIGIQELIKTGGTLASAVNGLIGMLLYGIALLALAAVTLREHD